MPYHNTFKVFATLMFFSASIVLSSCCVNKKNKTETSTNLLRVCPEEWIQNKMPTSNSSEIKEYFIYEGKRREMKEFDLDWIKSNCSLKPTIVQ